jgi:hypothetical protein
MLFFDLRPIDVYNYTSKDEQFIFSGFKMGSILAMGRGGQSYFQN